MPELAAGLVVGYLVGLLTALVIVHRAFSRSPTRDDFDVG